MKLKYSFMSFSTPDQTLEQMLETAARYGYDAVEPRMDAGHRHGVESAATPLERQRIRDLSAARGIPLACLATSLQYAKPEMETQAVADTHLRIDLAADCGIPRLRVFGGVCAKGLSREESSAQLIACFRQVADHAAERGVTLCMETHDDWCHPAHVADVMRTVHHPAIRVNWDIMHPVRQAGVGMDEAFETLLPFIRHVHFHDGRSLRDTPADGSMMLPIGTGIVDHRRALLRLREMRYDGYLSGEWINWTPFEVHLPGELATLKQYEAELAATETA